MALTFGGLLTEFYARGFDYLDDSASGTVRAKRWINDAYHAINELDNWPYLEATAMGAAPLTIADLRTIDSVYDVTNDQVLTLRAANELVTEYGDLASLGIPKDCWVSGGNTVNVCPVQAVSLSVRYWKVATDLVNTTDEPLIPDRFRYVLVDYAVAAAMRDSQDPDAVIAQAAGDATVAKMRAWAGMMTPDATFSPLIGDDL